MKWNKIILIVLMLCLIPLAIAWTPSSSIDLWNYYTIYNGTDINSTEFYQNGSKVLDESSTINTSNINQSELNVNSSTYWDGESSQSNLNVNSSTWWAGITDFVSNGWFYDSNNNLTFNETKLNNTIDTRDTDTFWDITGSIYLYNNSGILDVNETKLNSTIDDRDTDTFWNITGSQYLYNDSGILDVNSTELNTTADSRIDLKESDLNVNSSNYWNSYNIASDLNYLILSYWNNITNRPTHLTNFTDDIDYSTKNVNSSEYWDDLDVPSDLNNQIISDWDNITNKFITAITGSYLFISGSTLDFNDTLLNSTFQKDISSNCDGTNFVSGVFENGTLNCTTPPEGDITAVNTNGDFLNGGGVSGELNITFDASQGVSNWGNWSDDKSSYYTSTDVDTLGNWSADKSDYYTSTNIDNFDYMQELVNDTSPQLGGDLDANSFNITGLDNLSSTGAGYMNWNGSAWLVVSTTSTLILG